MSSGRDRMARKDAKYGEVKNFWGDPVNNAAYAKRQLRWGALYKRDCKLCGCPLGLGMNYQGKSIALDLRAPVYCVDGSKTPGRPDGVILTQICYVDHFATCKKLEANDGGSGTVCVESGPVSGPVLEAGSDGGPSQGQGERLAASPAVPGACGRVGDVPAVPRSA